MVRRSTWILLGALAVVALLYAGWQRLAPAAPEAVPTLGPESPWSLSPEQVVSIRVADLSAPGVVVVKREAELGWRLTTPPAVGADSARIEAALTSVLAPVVRQVLAAPADLAPFGLAPARFRLTLLMADGTAHSMDVGIVDPTGSVYYAQVPGDGQVWLISRFSLEDLLGLVETVPYPLPTETPTPTVSATGTP